MANEPSQADHRAWAEFTDQHGRVWGANTENKTRHPCSGLEPQFQAPLLMSSEYLKVSGFNRINIEYQACLNDMDRANAEYDKGLRDYAFQLFGTQAPSHIENPPPELMALVGERPGRVPREFVEAALSDNQWVLGLNPNVPGWAEPLVKHEERKKAPPRMRAYPDGDDTVYQFRYTPPGGARMPDGKWVSGKKDEVLAHLEQHFPAEHAEVLVEA
ncbi:hypothetical protein LCGC14_1932380 [marine sediment metagenome]|uniref:Uncharacterized protein n=1 Tax=marine sediment metagenome TaxID=412755 RepID=A0A0F9GB17_9ZZZZ